MRILTRSLPQSSFLQADTVVDARHQTVLRRAYRRVVYAGAYAHWRWWAPFLASFARPLDRGARNKWLLFETVANLESKLIVVDSSKHYLEAAALYRSAPRRTKVILLVRDGRAVFYSGLKRGRPRHKALAAWQQTYERAVPLLERVVDPKDFLNVRYEDLAADPARELQRICRFIGVAFDAGMLEFRSRTHHVVNGNDMRLGRNAGIRVDESWRRSLSPADLEYFERRGGALNERLGYRALG